MLRTETATLTLTIHDWWHCSAGQSQRSGINVLVVRDDGLPLVPGSTCKGLLREALHQAEAFAQQHKQKGKVPKVPAGATEWLLGLRRKYRATTPEELGTRRFSSEPGHLAVDNAVLPPAWRTWSQTEEGKTALEDLSQVLTSTAIGDDGLVIPQTLRSIEVMPPMTLRAELTLIPRADETAPDWVFGGTGWRSVVAAALPLLRAAGSQRNRGLGRLTARLEQSDAAEVTL